MTGAAIEARLYAEDPYRDFLPVDRTAFTVPPAGRGQRRRDHGARRRRRVRGLGDHDPFRSADRQARHSRTRPGRGDGARWRMCSTGWSSTASPITNPSSPRSWPIRAGGRTPLDQLHRRGVPWRLHRPGAGFRGAGAARRDRPVDRARPARTPRRLPRAGA